MALKHNYGQYFTSIEIVRRVLEITFKHIDNPKNVLEPSFGDGEFLRGLLEYSPNLNIDAFEIDPDVFQDIDGVNCYLDDFLFRTINKKYSLIVGNPPYIELVYSFYDDIQKEIFKKKYGKNGRGRVNLIHAFFDEAFKCLESGGVISYLLPSSILTSPWYNDIRERIYNDFTIKELVEEIPFPGVSIKVVLLVIKNEKSDNRKHIVKKGNVYEIIENGSMVKGGKTIKSLGYKVGIGQYCWSHYKDELNDDQKGYKLLYSSYIKNGEITESPNKNKQKKVYLNIPNPVIIDNVIVLPRTTSKKPKLVLIKNNEYLLENHVVYITHQDVDKLELLYDYLTKNGEGLENVLNSTNLTKTEVENIMCDL